MPLSRLIFSSNISDFLLPIIEKWDIKSEVEKPPSQRTKRMSKEIKQLIRTIEDENIARLIDDALLNRDEAMFNKLVKIQAKRG